MWVGKKEEMWSPNKNIETEKAINTRILAIPMFPAGYVNLVYELDREKSFVQEANVGLSLLEGVLADTLSHDYGLKLPRGNLFLDEQKKKMTVRRGLMFKEKDSFISYRRSYSYSAKEFDEKLQLLDKGIRKEHRMKIPYISDTVEEILLGRPFKEKAVLGLITTSVTIRGKDDREESYSIRLGRKEIKEIKDIYHQRHGLPPSERKQKMLAKNLDYRIDKFLAAMRVNPSRHKDRNIEKVLTFFLDSVLTEIVPYRPGFNYSETVTYPLK